MKSARSSTLRSSTPPFAESTSTRVPCRSPYQTRPMTRMTIPDVLRLIESQTLGKFQVNDFVPVPAASDMQLRYLCLYRWRRHNAPASHRKRLDYLDYIKNRVLPDSVLNKGSLGLMVFFFSSGLAEIPLISWRCRAKRAACREPYCWRYFQTHDHDYASRLHGPLDFNQKNLMKCCKDFLLPAASRYRSAPTTRSATASRPAPNSKPSNPSVFEPAKKVKPLCLGRLLFNSAKSRSLTSIQN